MGAPPRGVKELLLAAAREHEGEVAQLRAEVGRLRARGGNELTSKTTSAPLLTLRVVVRGLRAACLLEEERQPRGFLNNGSSGLGRQTSAASSHMPILRQAFPSMTQRPLEPLEQLAPQQGHGVADPGVLALSETLQQHRVESRQMFEDMLQRLTALSWQQPSVQPRRETVRREIQVALAAAVGAMPEDVEISLARESDLEDLLVVNACVVLQASCFGQGAGASLDQGALCDVVVSAVRGITGSGCISGEVMSASIPGNGNVTRAAGHKVVQLATAFEGDPLSSGSDSPFEATNLELNPELRSPTEQEAAQISDAVTPEGDALTNGYGGSRQTLTPKVTSLNSSKKSGANSLLKGISRRNSGAIRETDHSSRCMHLLDRLVRHVYFEVTFLLFILANTMIMAAEAEYDGYVTANQLGLGGPSQGWQTTPVIFETLEFVFGCMFILEVMLKVSVHRTKFFKSYWCDFDLIVVILWIVEKCAAAQQMPTLVLRISRLVRALRLVRLTKTMWFADTLSLMIVALKASLSATVWSILLFFTISMCAALLMTHVARSFILGDTPLAADTSHVWSPAFITPEERREQLYLHFGTFWRSFLTVLELTVGNWVPVTRMVQECMNEWLAVAIVMYQMMMGFAFLKVVQGVFLHETFRVAKSDNELMIRDAMRDSARFKHQMEDLLYDVDADGSGMINKEEFRELFGHERVSFFLGALGLDVADKENLWRLVKEDTGKSIEDPEVSVQDLAAVIGRIRGTSRSIDLVTVLHKLEHLEEHMRNSAQGRRGAVQKSQPMPRERRQLTTTEQQQMSTTDLAQIAA